MRRLVKKTVTVLVTYLLNSNQIKSDNLILKAVYFRGSEEVFSTRPCLNVFYDEPSYPRAREVLLWWGASTDNKKDRALLGDIVQQRSCVEELISQLAWRDALQLRVLEPLRHCLLAGQPPFFS